LQEQFRQWIAAQKGSDTAVQIDQYQRDDGASIESFAGNHVKVALKARPADLNNEDCSSYDAIFSSGPSNLIRFLDLFKVALKPGGAYFLEVDKKAQPEWKQMVNIITSWMDNIVARGQSATQPKIDAWSYGILSIDCFAGGCVISKQGGRRMASDSAYPNSFLAAARASKTDKVARHESHHPYQAYLGPLRTKKMKMLEIGLGCDMHYAAGHSVKLWQNYLPGVELRECNS
jgi:hypothetical protein